MKQHNDNIRGRQTAKPPSLSFLKFLSERIDYLLRSLRIGTARNYRRVETSLKHYLNGKDLLFSEIDSIFADSYNDWLMEKGMLRNSASFHMRILRAVYNNGVKKGLTDQQYPFREVYTGVDKTRKRAISADMIRRLINLDIDDTNILSRTRDFFLFSLFTRGMAFVDIAYLKKKDIVGDRLVYERQKTGQTLVIQIEKEVREIIDKYKERNLESRYLFPILTKEDEKEKYQEYERALCGYNYRLGKLSEMLGGGIKLTSYTARHTWATIAMELDVPLSVISAGMGHTSERTTRIYLESLNYGKIDSANRKILDNLI